VNTFSSCHSDVLVDYDHNPLANGRVSLDGQQVVSGELTGLTHRTGRGRGVRRTLRLWMGDRLASTGATSPNSVRRVVTDSEDRCSRQTAANHPILHRCRLESALAKLRIALCIPERPLCDR
jgi:hypothetical protein